MYIYKYMKLTRQNMKYFVQIVCNEIQVKVNLEITYFLFLFAFSILSQLFLIWGCTWITPSREYKTYACLPLVRGFFCLVLYSGSSYIYVLCILFISGVAGQTSCPEAGRWSEFQDGEIQPRRRPTGSLQEVHDDGAPLSSEEDWSWGPTEAALACWYVWPLALDLL